MSRPNVLRFTLLFEQAAMVLVKEMPVMAAARIMDITDKSFWRIVFHHVERAMSNLDLSYLRGIGLDETSSGKRHQYVTVFIDLDRGRRSVIFAVPGKDKECNQLSDLNFPSSNLLNCLP